MTEATSESPEAIVWAWPKICDHSLRQSRKCGACRPRQSIALILCDQRVPAVTTCMFFAGGDA
jgi:hypothetical protein